ncbi:MAG: glycosyltransferase family 4 protein, partial [Acidobacteriota bacterium]|nr:glycosyltransferase family 4 protein [Acidobacteriota bacterium]
SRLRRRLVLISSRRDLGFMRSPKQRIAYRMLGRFYDQVQAVSDEVRQYSITADGLDPEKVITVPNGIELDESGRDRASVRKELGIGMDAPVVISVGHIRYIKGTDLVVDVAQQVCSKRPAAVFLIAGSIHEREYYEALKARVAERGLSNNIRFLGRRSDIRDLLRASDAFCLLSRSEGMSNALLEAMAERLPCVATSVGGNPEVLVDESTGLLVPVEDAGAAAGAVLRILDDRELAARLGQASRVRAEERFSARAMVDRIAASYEALVSRQLGGVSA